MFKQLVYAIGIMDYAHLEGFGGIIIDIYHVIVKHVGVIITYIPA